MNNNKYSDDSIFLGGEDGAGEQSHYHRYSDGEYNSSRSRGDYNGSSHSGGSHGGSGSSHSHHSHHSSKKKSFDFSRITSVFEGSSLRHMINIIIHGPAGRVLIYLFIVFLVVFILPRFSCFSHVIDVDGNTASTSDAVNVNGYFIEVGAENENVVKLQKSLYKLKYLGFDDISGTFDTTTLTAMNNFMGNTEQKETGCSYDVYEAILNKAEGKAAPAAPAPTSTAQTGNNEGTEQTSTTTQAPSSVKMVRVTAASTRIRREPIAGSFAYYLLVKGDEFKYISETTDASGNRWYKIEYNAEVSGWVIASDVELF